MTRAAARGRHRARAARADEACAAGVARAARLAILAAQAGQAWAGSGGNWKNAASSFAGYYTGFNLVQGQFDTLPRIEGQRLLAWNGCR